MSEITGSIVALVTPFKNGELDEETLRNLVEFHIENGTHGIVPCGTTGESATLSHEEHCKVIEIVVEQVNKRIPVIAGAGSNSTKEAIFLTEHAKKSGADAVLSITPYYNKPTQAGLYEHFKAIAEAVDIPLILYNVPGRTGVNLAGETTVELSKIKNIVGVKEASGNVDQAGYILSHTDSSFSLYSGEDSLNYPLIAIGAKGVISVVANIAPKLVSQMVEAALKGDEATARVLYYKLLNISKKVFVETNPIPCKYALNIMGLISKEIRLPLVPLSEKYHKDIQAALAELDIKFKA